MIKKSLYIIAAIALIILTIVAIEIVRREPMPFRFMAEALMLLN